MTSFRNLKTRLKQEVVAIGEFLNVKEKYLHGRHMDCILNNPNGIFKRPKHVIPIDIFTVDMNETMELYREQVKQRSQEVVSNTVIF